MGFPGIVQEPEDKELTTILLLLTEKKDRDVRL
jgi:hypothetical protein